MLSSQGHLKIWQIQGIWLPCALRILIAMGNLLQLMVLQIPELICATALKSSTSEEIFNVIKPNICTICKHLKKAKKKFKKMNEIKRKKERIQPNINDLNEMDV